MSSLRKKMVTGLFWTVLEILGKVGFEFIVQIILARLLLPKEFGLLGMLLIFITLSNAVINSGFSQALIRELNPSQEDYSTVFYYNFIMALILYIILFLCAQSISVFFDENRLEKLIKVYGIVLIIGSFSVIQRTKLIKNLNFKPLTIINLISTLIAGSAAISFAVNDFGVWSLVYKQLFFQTISMILLVLYGKWLPSLSFKIESFKRLFGFGWKLMLTSLLSQLYNNLYSIIIGKYFSITELGYYTNSKKLKDLPVKTLSTAVTSVAYPALSSIEDESKFKSVFKKLFKNTAFLMFPVLFGLIAVADNLIIILFGENWIFSVMYFRGLCFAGIVFPLSSLNLMVFNIKGRSDLFLKLDILKIIVGFVSVYTVILLEKNLTILIIVLIFNSVFSFLIGSIFSGKYSNYSLIEQLSDLKLFLLNSLVMCVAVYITGKIVSFTYVPTLILQIIIGFLVYLFGSKIFRIEELNIYIENIKKLFFKIK